MSLGLLREKVYRLVRGMGKERRGRGEEDGEEEERDKEGKMRGRERKVCLES